MQILVFRGTLRVTPAMAAGVTDKLWDVSDIVKVLEDWEANEVASPTKAIKHAAISPVANMAPTNTIGTIGRSIKLSFDSTCLGSTPIS